MDTEQRGVGEVLGQVLRAHARAIVLTGAILLAVVISGGYVLAIRSVPSSCSYPAPTISLPVSLRAAGELDQPLPLVNGEVDTASATEAIQTMYPDIAAPVALPEVRELPRAASSPPVIVIPFRSQVGTDHVVAVMVFAVGCSNNAYFSAAENWQRGPDAQSPPVSSYLQVTESQAERTLGTRGPLVLVYGADPLHPSWKDPQSGRSAAAR